MISGTTTHGSTVPYEEVPLKLYADSDDPAHLAGSAESCLNTANQLRLSGDAGAGLTLHVKGAFHWWVFNFGADSYVNDSPQGFSCSLAVPPRIVTNFDPADDFLDPIDPFDPTN